MLAGLSVLAWLTQPYYGAGISAYVETWIVAQLPAIPQARQAGHALGSLAAWAPFALLALFAGALILRLAATLAGDGLRRILARKGGSGGDLDIRLCVDRDTGEPVILHERDRWLHLLVVGQTGTGKTKKVLEPMIEQDLRTMKRLRKQGRPMGITVIEPKGDLADVVEEMAHSMDLPVVKIDPGNPNSPHFNPLEGPADTVAEVMRTVLRQMFGRQEAFFSQVQQTVTRNLILLLKANYGDKLNMVMLTRSLRSMQTLRSEVDKYVEKHSADDDLVQYFENDILGQTKEKYVEFLTGLRQQLEDITGNPNLRSLITGSSDIDLDRHLSEGGVLLVNTGLSSLQGRISDVFGQMVMLHFQAAVMRRPGNEDTRAPHVLYIDEFGRYSNPGFEQMLTLARSYRCAVVMALQDTQQLIVEGTDKTFRSIVLSQTRNKLALGGMAPDDAKYFALEGGEEFGVEVRHTQRTSEIPLPWIRWTTESRSIGERWKPRWNYTELMELPANQVLYKIVVGGSPMPPGIGIVSFSDFTRSRIREKSRRNRKGSAAEKRIIIERTEAQSEDGNPGEIAEPVPVAASQDGETEKDDFFRF